MSCTVTTTVGYIDLATFSEIEAFTYGGDEAITYFVRGVQKGNWFTQVPVCVRNDGQHGFGQRNAGVRLNRQGDYVLQALYRCKMPVLTHSVVAGSTIRYCRNLMHNLFSRITLTFNELVLVEFDNYFLDMRHQFRTEAAKRVAYRNAIGDHSGMTTGVACDNTTPLGTGEWHSLRLPFWFGDDSGSALPVAALPFNEVKINYDYRMLADLLVLITAAGVTSQPLLSNLTATAASSLEVSEPTTICHYAIVHQDERAKMGDAPRDMLIDQIQTAQTAAVTANSNTFDLRMSHAVVAIFFALRNSTVASEWSNYTTAPLDANAGASGSDPIGNWKLVYENTDRLNYPADYFSRDVPLMYSCTAPEETGYHAWFYSLDWTSPDMSGSTNFGKLANVSVTYTFSAAGAASLVAAAPNTQTYTQALVVINKNICRISNGSLGLPIL